MSNSLKGRSQEYQRYLMPEVRESTFSPRINEESNNLNRSYDDMLIWLEKSRIKTEMQREFREIADYDERDFKPCIKSGSKTKARYLEPKVQKELPAAFFENREIFENIDPELNRVYEKEIRKEFMPKINSKSRQLVAQKKRRSKKKSKISVSHDGFDYENYQGKIKHKTKDTKRSTDYNYLNLEAIGGTGSYDANDISTLRNGEQISLKLFTTNQRKKSSFPP